MTRNQQAAINRLYQILSMPESTTEEGNGIYNVEIPQAIINQLKTLVKPPIPKK